MIQVSVKSGRDRRLKIKGHALYNPGNDIVCAACSAIAYSLMGWMHNNPQHISRQGEMCEESGYVEISARGNECFDAAFDTAVIGLAQVANAYPENVEIEWT